MSRILLVTRPKYDDGTEYLAYYASLILKLAENKGIQAKDFQGKNANRKEVIKFLEKMSPELIFINGHGSETELTGHNGETLLSEEVNDLRLLKNKIIYARACDAGSSFGKKAVMGGNGCFIGYKSPFSVWIDERWSANPSKDKTAALFLEPSNEIMTSLLKGDPTHMADQKSKNLMIENMKEILKMEEKKEPAAMNLLQVLWANFEGQVLHGNPDISF